MTEAPTVYKFGTMEASAPTADTLRMAVLLWTLPGGGKTTLASTAPGKKLWLNFDPDGCDSIRARAADRGDVILLDLSDKGHQVTQNFTNEDPYNIGRVLKENSDIETVVFDSLTAFADLATDNAIASPTNKNSTITAPGQNGYAWRNSLTRKAFVNVLRLTKKYNRHFIATCHEKEEMVGDTVEGFTLSLSSSLIGQLGLQVGEIWYLLSPEKGSKRILVKPARKRKPMKSRMFAPDVIEFDWEYDPATYEGAGIETWFNAWKANNGRPIDPRKL